MAFDRSFPVNRAVSGPSATSGALQASRQASLRRQQRLKLGVDSLWPQEKQEPCTSGTSVLNR